MLLRDLGISETAALTHYLVTEDYYPEGYILIERRVIGKYELGLWQGKAHIKGEPVTFYEVSLRLLGLDFDPKSQFKKFRGNPLDAKILEYAMTIIADWVEKYGEIYIGSYNLDKVKKYHAIFKRYGDEFLITDPYPAFDECEGVPEYFKITAR